MSSFMSEVNAQWIDMCNQRTWIPLMVWKSTRSRILHNILREFINPCIPCNNFHVSHSTGWKTRRNSTRNVQPYLRISKITKETSLVNPFTTEYSERKRLLRTICHGHRCENSIFNATQNIDKLVICFEYTNDLCYLDLAKDVCTSHAQKWNLWTKILRPLSNEIVSDIPVKFPYKMGGKMTRDRRTTVIVTAVRQARVYVNGGGTLVSGIRTWPAVASRVPRKYLVARERANECVYVEEAYRWPVCVNRARVLSRTCIRRVRRP